MKPFVSRTALCAISVSSLSMLLLVTGCTTGGTQAEWTELFNGRDLAGWQAMKPDNNAWQVAGNVAPDATNERKLAITQGTGILVNGPNGKTSNLFTDCRHGDCEAHIEFMVPKGSNSGVYFLGKYEIQILDSYGVEKLTFNDCGGIYARWVNRKTVDGHPPRVNASRPPGQWQVYDVIFRAPRFDESGKKTANAMFVKVMHNGVLVHENVELKGPTRAAMPGLEQPTGPLMIQGDHGPVAYRNLRIRPLD